MNAQAQRVDVLAVVAAAKQLLDTLTSDGFVKPSAKNSNAGFVDLRDWYAMQGEVLALKRALEAMGGEQPSGCWDVDVLFKDGHFVNVNRHEEGESPDSAMRRFLRGGIRSVKEARKHGYTVELGRVVRAVAGGPSHG